MVRSRQRRICSLIFFWASLLIAGWNEAKCAPLFARAVALVDAAHQHGIAVIVDVVYGHTGIDFGCTT
jgi:hypothetical protein